MASCRRAVASRSYQVAPSLLESECSDDELAATTCGWTVSEALPVKAALTRSEAVTVADPALLKVTIREWTPASPGWNA